MRVERGDVWLVGLDLTIANEQGGVRPCLVVSGTRFNALPIDQAMVVTLTSRDRGLPHHVAVAEGGLDRPSWARCEAVRAVSTRRFRRRLGTVADETLAAVTDQLVFWLA